MNKYISVFKISIVQELVYKLNFVIWRLRNIIQILVFYFLWTAVFEGSNISHFGYTKENIIAYSILLIFIRAIVLSTKSTEVSGQIANGDLSNYLLKPLNFFKYLIVKDMSSKSLNIIFSIFEIILLFIFLKPVMFIQTNPLFILLFVVSLIIAAFIFFNIVMITNAVPFWIPELGWGAQFLVLMIFVEFLSGAFFPLDVFPKAVLEFLKYTPFPYLIFIPIKTYLGTESVVDIIKNISIGGLWSVILWMIMNKVWKKGLKVYDAVGR